MVLDVLRKHFKHAMGILTGIEKDEMICVSREVVVLDYKMLRSKGPFQG